MLVFSCLQLKIDPQKIQRRQIAAVTVSYGGFWYQLTIISITIDKKRTLELQDNMRRKAPSFQTMVIKLNEKICQQTGITSNT